MARKPGPKHPEKYPVATGESYDYYGEQPGFDYDPYTDEYVPDKETVDNFYEQSGIDRPDKKEDEVDLVSDVLLPIGATTLAYQGVKEIVSNPKEVASGIGGAWDWATGAAAEEVPKQVGGQVADQVAQTVAGQAAPAAAASAPFSLGVGAPELGTASFGGLEVPMAGYEGMAAAPAETGILGGLGTLGQAAGVAGQAYFYGDQIKDAYDKMQSGRESGAGALKAGLLAGGPFSAWAAPVVDFLGIKTGKHKDQYARDAWRDLLYDRGLINDEHGLTLADGSTFDVGKDGGARYQGRRVHDLDLNDPNQTGLIPIADVMSLLETGGDEKLTNDASGYYVNAATSSGDAGKNIAKMLADRGLDHDSAYGAIHQMQQEGMISQERGDAAKNALDEYYGVGAYAPGGSHYGVKSKPPAPFSMGVEPPKVPNAAPPQIGGRPAPFTLGQTQQSLAPGSGGGTRPLGVTPSSAQNPMFGGGQSNDPNRAPFSLGRGQKERISPGVWRDEKGTYNSKTGVRGQ